jgi:hypothetical protein
MTAEILIAFKSINDSLMNMLYIYIDVINVNIIN